MSRRTKAGREERRERRKKGEKKGEKEGGREGRERSCGYVDYIKR